MKIIFSASLFLSFVTNIAIAKGPIGSQQKHIESIQYVVTKLTKLDSIQNLKLDSVGLKISKLPRESAYLISQPANDTWKSLLPIITFLLGAGWALAFDQIKERRSEGKIVRRWKAAISALPTAIANQVKYNLEVVEALNQPNFSPVMPGFEYKLSSNSFSGLDTGALFHYFEKKNESRGSEWFGDVQVVSHSVSDLSRQIMDFFQKYDRKMDQHYADIGTVMRSLQKGIANLADEIANDVDSSDSEKSALNELGSVFLAIAVEDSGVDLYDFDSKLFRPINHLLKIFRNRVARKDLENDSLSGIQLIATMQDERRLYRDALLVINKELQHAIGEVPKVLAHFG